MNTPNASLSKLSSIYILKLGAVLCRIKSSSAIDPSKYKIILQLVSPQPTNLTDLQKAIKSIRYEMGIEMLQDVVDVKKNSKVHLVSIPISEDDPIRALDQHLPNALNELTSFDDTLLSLEGELGTLPNVLNAEFLQVFAQHFIEFCKRQERGRTIDIATNQMEVFPKLLRKEMCIRG